MNKVTCICCEKKLKIIDAKLNILNDSMKILKKIIDEISYKPCGHCSGTGKESTYLGYIDKSICGNCRGIGTVSIYR